MYSFARRNEAGLNKEQYVRAYSRAEHTAKMIKMCCDKKTGNALHHERVKIRHYKYADSIGIMLHAEFRPTKLPLLSIGDYTCTRLPSGRTQP